MSPGSEQSETHDVFGFCIPFMFFSPYLLEWILTDFEAAMKQWIK